MTFFLDENFPKSALTVLEARGHVVLDIRGTDREGASDADVFSMAQEREAVLLTTDRDFFHTVPLLFPSHSGIVVVALRQPNRRAILSRLAWLLNRLGDRPPRGKAYLLRDRTCAVYPAGD